MSHKKADSCNPLFPGTESIWPECCHVQLGEAAMKLQLFGVIIFVVLLMFIVPAAADQATIPKSGTVFIGEQGLDITATGALQGVKLVWYGPGGSISNAPAAVMTVADPTDFYVSPVLFADKTGPWFIENGNTLAFYVQEPQIAIRVFDLSAGFEVTKNTVWVPRGDVVGFQIDTSVSVLATRPRSAGAPVTIRIQSPSGVMYSAVDSYKLEDIMISSSPFSTGPVWSTGDFEGGNYTVWAESTGNEMNDNYPQEGKTISSKVTFLLQNVNPLITSEKTTVITTIPTLTPTTMVTTATVPPTVETTLQTPPPTELPTTIPPATTPGFSAIIAVLSLAAVVVLTLSRR
jgi:hypothetical protein